MWKRIADFCRSDLGVLVLAAGAGLVLHVAANGRYGFHRDELQTLDDARHLDWGFVAYPPITPLIGRLELILFGTSLVGFRVFSAIAVSMVMVLAGLIAKELGGNRYVQLLAAVAAGISPVSLVQGSVFQYVSFDYLWGVTVTYLLTRLLKSEDPRWWVPIGAILGIGMETRYTTGFLALGRWRGAPHARTAISAQRLALVGRRHFHSRFSAESDLADATSLHFSGVPLPSARPRPAPRPVQGILPRATVDLCEPRRVSRARYTSPMPPAPRGDWIS